MPHSELRHVGRHPTTQLHRTGGRPPRYLGLSGLADGDERCDVARGRLPVGMWQRANHQPDDRRCLIDPIRPCRHEVADIVIDPSFAVDISAALKPSVIGIAVGVVAGERQTPAGDRRASRTPARTSARSRRGFLRRNARHRRGRQGQGCCGSFGNSRSRQTERSSRLPFLVWRRAPDPSCRVSCCPINLRHRL
jgi:hypothetical protein